VTTDPNELTPAERRAFDALPRDAAPPPGLEDRTVALLQARGLLAVPLRPVAGGPRRVHPAWLVGSIAAGLALFASGAAVGQYLGARSATLAAAVGAGSSITERAQHVEQAGSRYLEALASFSQHSDSADVATRRRATQAALTALGSAAEEVSRLAPDDPLAAAVLRGLAERSRGAQPAPTRAVVWY
jgi:hypothetical protein